MIFFRLFLLALLLLLPLVVSAHNPGNSYLFINQDNATANTVSNEGNTGALVLRWDIALSDLEFVVGLDSNLDQKISWQEVKAKQAAITAYAYAHLSLKQNNQPCSLSTKSLQIVQHSDGHYVVINSKAACSASIGALTLNYSLMFAANAQHRGIILDQRTKDSSSTYIASIDQQQIQLEKNPNRFSQFMTFIGQGIWHILIGFDHILFVISLMLPVVLVYKNQQWQAVQTLKPAVSSLLRIVTLFTLAHSIALTLATLDLVRLPSRWVESAIALSVIVMALNTIKPIFTHVRGSIVFLFGLIHGFGFANVLNDLNLDQGALLLSLFGFNIGVEIGQFLILLLLFPIAYGLRKTRFYRQFVLMEGSVLIALVATVWLVQRILA